MFDWRDIMFFIISTLFLEKAPLVASAIIKYSSRRLPEQYRDRYQTDWLSDMACKDGRLSKLLLSLQIMFCIPALRSSLGEMAVSLRFPAFLVFGFHSLIATTMAILGLLSYLFPEISPFILKILYLNGFTIISSFLITVFYIKEVNYKFKKELLWTCVPLFVLAISCLPISLEGLVYKGHIPPEMWSFSFAVAMLGLTQKLISVPRDEKHA